MWRNTRHNGFTSWQPTRSILFFVNTALRFLWGHFQGPSNASPPCNYSVILSMLCFYKSQAFPSTSLYSINLSCHCLLLRCTPVILSLPTAKNTFIYLATPPCLSWEQAFRSERKLLQGCPTPFPFYHVLFV